MNRRVLCGVAAAVAGCFALACTADPSVALEDTAASVARVGFRDIAPPPGLDVVAPRRGPSLDTARQPLATVVDALSASKHVEGGESLEEPAASIGEENVGEPPLAAQKSYLAARLAWREGLQYDAIKKLHDARRLAPRDAAIYRSLGRIYGMQGNKDQSLRHFERASALEPEDPYTLFMLARLELDRDELDAAIALMSSVVAQAEDTPPGRIGFLPLARFFLATALQRKGYDHAAAEQWRHFLSQPIRIEAFSGRLRAEAHHLRQGSDRLWQRVGDAHQRLGEPNKALEAYLQAAALSGTLTAPLAARLTYARLVLGQELEARRVVMQFASVVEHAVEGGALIDYLVTASEDRASLVEDLRQLYVDTQYATPALLALVRLVPAEQRVALLTEHLDRRPSDRTAFETFIHTELASGEVDRLQRALHVAAIAIKHFPPATGAYVATLLQRSPNRDDLLAVVEGHADDEPAMRALHGHLLLRTGAVEQALEAFADVLAVDPQWHAARITMGETLIDIERYEDAAAILQSRIDADDPESLALQAVLWHETDRTEEAVAHLDEALKRHPGDARLVIVKARLDREAGRLPEAEMALLALVKARPSTEKAYATLIDLYLFDRPPEWKQRHGALVQRLQQMMPQCQTARRERARQLFSAGEHAKSEAELRQLLEDDASDLRTLRVLLAVLAESGRTDDGIELIDQWAEANAMKRTFLELTEQFFLEVVLSRFEAGEPDKVVEYVDVAITKPLRDPRTLLWIQRRTLLQVGRIAEIEPRIRTAATRFPEHEPDLLLTWAVTLEELEQPKRAIAIMEEILEKYPGHVPTSNSLGYTWADRGGPLDRAERLVQIAVKAESANPAYLDSLGWVYYKQGRFEAAVEQLSKASLQLGGRDPIILDHLGDALYRLGRQDEAVRYWRDALNAITPDLSERDTAMNRLRPSLTEKLQAIQGRQSVPVAESPGSGARESQ